jgi:DNA-binding protein H-NS
MTTYHELLAQRDSLDKQISDALRAESVEAIDTVRRLVADYALTAKDCGFAGSESDVDAHVKPVAPADIKYRGPNGETWSGRGRRPAWLGSLIEDGRSADEFLIAKEAA